MKIKRLLTIASLSVGLFGFQNCTGSGINFSSSSKSSSAPAPTSPGPTAPAVTSVYFESKATSVQDNTLKVLVVVDNSNTMSQSQSYLSAGIDSLINGLTNYSVDLAVTTTTQSYGEYQMFDAQGNRVAGNVTIAGQYYSHSKTNAFINNRIAFRPSDSGARRDSNIAQLRAAILQGTEGSPNEQGLCIALAAILDDNTTNSFFKPGDKAAILFITDEDDSHILKDCPQLTNRARRQFGTPEYRKFYGFATVNRDLSVAFSYLNDGVLKTETRRVIDRLKGADIEIPIASPINSLDDTRPCTTREQALAIPGLPAGAVIKEITSCKILFQSGAIITTPTNGQPAANACQGSFAVSAGGSVYSSIDDYLNWLTQQAGYAYTKLATCTEDLSLVELSREALPPVLFTTDPAETPLFRVLAKSLESKFGADGFLVSSIVMTPACQLQSGQAQGQAFMDMAALLNSNPAAECRHSVQPICRADYSLALSPIVSFSQKVNFPAASIRGDQVSKVQSAALVKANGSIQALRIGIDITIAASGLIELHLQGYVPALGDRIRVDLRK